MSAVTNLKAFDTPKKFRVGDVPWGQILWAPLKDRLSNVSEIKTSRPADRAYTVYKIKSMNAAFCPWYNLKNNQAGLNLETYGGEEVKAIIEEKLAKAPADSIVRQAVLSQGKKNKNKWAWVINTDIDKNDPGIIQWYADIILKFLEFIED